MGFAAAAPYVIPAVGAVASGLFSKKGNKQKQTQPTFYPVKMKDPKTGKEFTFMRMASAGGETYSQPSVASILGQGIAAGTSAWGTGQMVDKQNEFYQSLFKPANTNYKVPGGSYGGELV